MGEKGYDRHRRSGGVGIYHDKKCGVRVIKIIKGGVRVISIKKRGVLVICRLLKLTNSTIDEHHTTLVQAIFVSQRIITKS